VSFWVEKVLPNWRMDLNLNGKLWQSQGNTAVGLTMNIFTKRDTRQDNNRQSSSRHLIGAEAASMQNKVFSERRSSIDMLHSKRFFLCMGNDNFVVAGLSCDLGSDGDVVSTLWWPRCRRVLFWTTSLGTRQLRRFRRPNQEKETQTT
jgi:hypothetical protein